MPVGIITLEDVLEGMSIISNILTTYIFRPELIGEEIYDEFDAEGAATQSYIPPKTKRKRIVRKNSAPELAPEPVLPEASDVPSSSNTKPALEVPVSTTTKPRRPSSGNTPKPSIRPLPLPASLRNPWFLRSRSAPPSPRDGGRLRLGERVRDEGSVRRHVRRQRPGRDALPCGDRRVGLGRLRRGGVDLTGAALRSDAMTGLDRSLDRPFTRRRLSCLVFPETRSDLLCVFQ